MSALANPLLLRDAPLAQSGTRAAGERDAVADAPEPSAPAPDAFHAFRTRARALLVAGVTPDQAAPGWADWAAAEAGTPDLFALAEPAGDSGSAAAVRPSGVGIDLVVPAGDGIHHDGRRVDAACHTHAHEAPDLNAAPADERAEALRARTSVAAAPVPGAAGRDKPALASALTVPRGFVALARRVVLHSSPTRYARLYRLLWRLLHEPALRADPLDAELLGLRQMARAVQRDAYKMRAFVRFRPVPADAPAPALPDPAARPDSAATAPETLYVAWFEPEHDVLAAVAPWFARRFAGMRWAILTPRRSVRWCPREQRLHFGPGAARADAPAADAGEALWLAYYRHIFNPARLNVPLMRQHMPLKYWRNLPEAAEIAGLAAAADARTREMIEREPPLLSKNELTSGCGQAVQPVFIQNHRAPRARQAPVPGAALPTASEPVYTPALASAPGVRCATLADLRAAVQRCQACPLADCATQAVNGVGPERAALMLVGEQPGDQEDLAGQPFVGPAGQLLDQALARAGLDRATLYLTNAVRHFKHELRGKRRIHKTPGQREAAACLPWLLQEIELVQPAALLALGATAARSLLGNGVTLTEARGRWWPGPGGRPVLVTWHPAALLRLPPADKPRVWAEWLADLRMAARGPA